MQSSSPCSELRLTFDLSLNSLIAKWKKTGYEKLCCLRCIQTRVRLSLRVVFPSYPFSSYSHRI